MLGGVVLSREHRGVLRVLFVCLFVVIKPGFWVRDTRSGHFFCLRSISNEKLNFIMLDV